MSLKDDQIFVQRAIERENRLLEAKKKVEEEIEQGLAPHREQFSKELNAVREGSMHLAEKKRDELTQLRHQQARELADLGACLQATVREKIALINDEGMGEAEKRRAELEKILQEIKILKEKYDNDLKSVEAYIEKVEKKMRNFELVSKFNPINFTRIEGLHSKLKILKDEFAEASENQRQVFETEKPNQEAAIVKMFSQLTRESACNLSAKLQGIYGAPVTKPEEKVEIPNTVDMPSEKSGQEDHVQELATADEPIDPNDLSVEGNFQRMLEQQTKRHDEELKVKRRERAEKNRAEQEEIRALASKLQNSKRKGQNIHRQEMADRCEDDVKEKPKKLPEKLLERERLLSLVFSWVPRVTWRVDDPEIQHSKNYSRVSGSTEREKSGTNELPEYFSVISEAENLLDGRGAHPETIPSLRGRIYKAFESSPKPDDTTSDEHFILRLIAQKTLVFLLDELQKRLFDWEMGQVEGLIGSINQNQSVTLTNIIDNVLKSLEAEIEKVEKEMREFELKSTYVSIDFTPIESLRSKLQTLKDKFAEALENQRQVPETENHEETVLEIFSQLAPLSARNLLAKLHESYGAPVLKDESRNVAKLVDLYEKSSKPVAANEVSRKSGK
ncbi:unnamed protein product [Caenorhabditis brenneri]